ncbi:tRNA methyltransferase complex GCD14 subunit-domain-containing protein [Podospora conica]|nr:tRNA methyltransferase complex GCD14 subunit-domain-containing protein [Schizothecium conicum]
MATPRVSPFLEPGLRTKPGSLAVVQLSRDNFLPVYLQEHIGEHDGYIEGAVVNTRFGSFPHSTLINVPWGSQIRASKVDTGSRGRKRKRQLTEASEGATPEPATNGPKRSDPADPDGAEADADTALKEAVADSSGFVHILPPTPEIWTTSLPHRTQVVYTPDYSYILYRLRALPGSTLIEAGAGSGSFTHAAVRAVYNGYPSPTSTKRKGKVISFEYNEDRYHKMQEELTQHGLDGLVQLTHRNVYEGGFLINDNQSPEAEAVFLDLPAPWEALPHLSRRRPDDASDDWVSPLHPKKSAYICTFSPCIEQVTKTVSALRRLGWVDIEMVEIMNRKLHTLRDRVGLNLHVDRGVNNSAKDVDEAIARLTEIEERFRENVRPSRGEDTEMAEGEGVSKAKTTSVARLEEDGTPAAKFPWKDGQLITRGEPEIKSHTSYLVFAVLPIEWSDEAEAAASAKFPLGKEQKVVGAMDKKAKKAQRRELLEQKQGDRKSRRKARDEKLAEEAVV